MKYETMIKILFLFLNRGKVTAKYIADRFEISTRTVMRYLDAISLAGIPLISEPGRNGGFYIAETFRLNSSFLTEREFNAVIATLSSYNEQLGSADIASAIDKLSATNKASIKSVDVKTGNLIIDGSAWNGSDNVKNVISLMEKSIENSFTVKIKYIDKQGEETVREIEPHVIILKQGAWYVYAFCHLRNEFRMFKAARILYADRTEHTFLRRETDFSANSLKGWFDELPTEYVDLWVDKRAIPDVEEWLGVGAVYKNAEGESFVSVKLPYYSWLISKVLSFGDKVKVISPEKLKSDVRNAAKQIMDLYD